MKTCEECEYFECEYNKEIGWCNYETIQGEPRRPTDPVCGVKEDEE
ncbi:MAG: hypothetical protein ACXADF_14510 [Candidatus Thorarchaeota archaeon]|jgi:hypothetical protein